MLELGAPRDTQSLPHSSPRKIPLAGPSWAGTGAPQGAGPSAPPHAVSPAGGPPSDRPSEPGSKTRMPLSLACEDGILRKIEGGINLSVSQG